MMADWAEHYGEADRLVDACPKVPDDLYDAARAENLAEAQVRALLAIADVLNDIARTVCGE